VIWNDRKLVQDKKMRGGDVGNEEALRRPIEGVYWLRIGRFGSLPLVCETNSESKLELSDMSIDVAGSRLGVAYTGKPSQFKMETRVG
jgi:hypothetical protein